MDKSKVEIADIDIEPGEAGKAWMRFVFSQIDGFVNEGRPIDVGICLPARNADESKVVRRAIGHLHKEGRHITVVILERGNDASN